MHQAPKLERRDFFRYRHAHDSFVLARRSLEHIHKNDAHLDPWLRYTLWAGFSVIYFRPFNQKPKAELAVNDDIVPHQLKSHHEKLRNVRNKVFAHTELAFDDRKKAPLNTLVFRLDEQAVPQFGFGYPWPKIEGPHVLGYYRLLDDLIEMTGERAVKIWDRWRPHVHLADIRKVDIWRINTEETPDDIFLPESKSLA